MTAIAAVVDKDGSVWMGGDSCVSCQFTSSLITQPKVWIAGDMIFGCAGAARLLQILRHQFGPPERPKRMTTLEYLTGPWIMTLHETFKVYGQGLRDGEHCFEQSLVIGYEGAVYYVDSEGAVLSPAEPYSAVGSGDHLVFGALFATENTEMTARARIQIALEAAAAFAQGVAPPFTILRLPPSRKRRR